MTIELVPDEAGNRFHRLGVPEPDDLILARRREEVAIMTERHAPDGAGVIAVSDLLPARESHSVTAPDPPDCA